MARLATSDNVQGKEPNQRSRGLTSLAIAHPLGTIALASVVVLLGLFFLDRLSVDLLPPAESPRLRVTIEYPGAAPEVIEQQLTRVMERSLAATEDLVLMESYAQEGRSGVVLSFEYGVDMDRVMLDTARNIELARAQLPADTLAPRISRSDPSQRPVVELGVTSTIRNEIEVRDWLENRLVPQLQSVPGVAEVEVIGGQIREFQVLLDLIRLDYYGVPLSEVERVLYDENFELAIGQVTSESFDINARADGRLGTAEEIEDLLLPGGDGSLVRLSEVAEVRDTFQDQRVFVRLNGEVATRIAVTKLPGANTVTVVDSVNAEVGRLRDSGFFPDDLTVESTRDQSYFIRTAIRTVSSAAFLGAFLAILVVLFFLGSLRKALIIGVSIPIALLATFTMMGLGNLTLNIMSLGGLALGVGLLLDNSIVILENIFRHREEYDKEPIAAAEDGSREVTTAVIASTATNLAAVLPFLLITGMAALVFRELILAISFAIVASLATALTLVPTLAALSSRIRWQSGFNKWLITRTFQRGVGAARDVYIWLARRVFRWRWLTVLGAAAGLGYALWIAEGLNTEFLPPVDDGDVFVSMQLPRGVPPEETIARTEQMEEVIASMPHVENIIGIAGGRLSGATLNPRSGLSRYNIQLTPASTRPEMPATSWVSEIEERLDALEIPGARISVTPPRVPGLRFATGDAPISFALVGDDLDELEDLGRELLVELEDIEGLTGLDLSRSDRSPILEMEVDRTRAAELGLSSREVASAVRTAVLGSTPTRIASGMGEYEVRMLVPRAERATADELDALLLFQSNGDPIRLGDIASFRLTDGPASITRENQLRVIRFEGDVNRAISDVQTINSEIAERIRAMELGDHLNLIFGGEEEVIEEANRTLRTVIFLAIFLVFVVLIVQYERLANPLIILSAAPLALMGVVAILWATNTSLSAPVLLGVVLLIGIVVNNSILLVEYIEIGRQEQSLEPFDAALEAGKIRFRPIAMTTLTTVCGMLPLALGAGEGAELMQPMALAVIGGLMISAFLTLFVVPCLYLLVSAAAEKMSGFITGQASLKP